MGQADATGMLKEYKTRGLNSHDTGRVLNHFGMEPASDVQLVNCIGMGHIDGGGIHFDDLHN